MLGRRRGDGRNPIHSGFEGGFIFPVGYTFPYSYKFLDTPLSDDDVEELCNYLSNGAFYFHLACEIHRCGIRVGSSVVVAKGSREDMQFAEINEAV